MSKERKVYGYPMLLSELRERVPTQVLIGGSRHPGTPGTIAMGGYGSFDHDLLYIVTYGKKQKDYREHLFKAKRQGQWEWTPEDGESIKLSVGLVTLSAEIRLGMLREDLPDAQIDIADGETGEPINPDKLAEAHEKALEAGASEQTARLFL